jgi:hypothetical protein
MGRMLMTLRKILEDIDDKKINFIEFRSVISIDSDDVDVLYGYCSYDGEQITSLDGDIYSLDDEIKGYKEDGNILTVYYEGEWVDNDE